MYNTSYFCVYTAGLFVLYNVVFFTMYGYSYVHNIFCVLLTLCYIIFIIYGCITHTQCSVLVLQSKLWEMQKVVALVVHLQLGSSFLIDKNHYFLNSFDCLVFANSCFALRTNRR